MDQINPATARAFRESRKVVADFEKYGITIAMLGDDLWTGYPKGRRREPISLWRRFRAADRDMLVKYLRATGRVLASTGTLPVYAPRAA